MFTYSGKIKIQENFKSVVDPNWAACSKYSARSTGVLH